jgi:hypothetical protein
VGRLRGRGRLRAGGGASDAVLPSGDLLGVWYASDYDASSNSIPNGAEATSPSLNIFRGGTNLLANTELWAPVNTTVTDDTGSDFSTFVSSNGNWYFGSKAGVTLPAGTYTVAATVKRNTGSDQEFAFTGDNTATRSATKTATATEQEFSYTFTRGAGFSINTVLLCSKDGATGANIAVKNLRLFAGGSDLGAPALDGTLYLGFCKNSTSPSVADNQIDMTGQGFGFIQLPAAETLTTYTAMAVVSKTAAGSSYDAFLSKAQAYADFTSLVELSGRPEVFFDSNQQFNYAGVWTPLSQGYHLITHAYTGTHRELWIDDVKLFSVAATVGPESVRDLFVGIVNATALYSGCKINAIALYGANKTDAEKRTAYTALSANAVTDGLTMADARILVAEGDSITAADGSWFYRYGANDNPKVVGANRATSGWSIADLEADAANLDAIIPPTPGTRDFILTVLIGRNDLVGYPGGTSAWLAALASYLDDRRAAGWTVVLCTLLPSTGVGFNTARGTANTELRLWTTNGSTVPGQHADHIIDFAADATMGPDAAASDTGLYGDGTHPTATGQSNLEAVARAVLNAI